MDSVDVQLLKYLSKRDNYEDMIDEIDKKLCTKESWQIVQDFKQYYDSHPNVTEIDSDDFKLWFRVTAHPGWKQEKQRIFTTIIDNVLDSEEPDSEVFFEQLENMRAQQTIRRAMQELDTGTKSVSEVLDQLKNYEPKESASRASPFYEATIVDIIDSDIGQEQGLFWRLEDLNKSIGPLKRGDFVIVAKRPEVGGTSFLCSELTYMLEQTDNGKAVLFNNEEENRKVKERIVTSALGVDGRYLYTNPSDADIDYINWLGNKDFRLASHEASSSIRNIEEVLSEDEYNIIGINVLGTKIKIPGMLSEPDHDKLQELGQRFRQLSHQHGPVIAVVQADPSATNMCYIPQDYIYKSKTALQGEADALIMIGKRDEDDEHVRYFHVAKNKMPPHPCTESSMKHLKSEAHFDYETGRFTSTLWKGNSRDNY